MKVKKKKTSFYILGYLLDLIIIIWLFGFFFFGIWRIWVIFSIKNPLYSSKIIFFKSKFAKIRQ